MDKTISNLDNKENKFLDDIPGILSNCDILTVTDF